MGVVRGEFRAEVLVFAESEAVNARLADMGCVRGTT